LAANGFLVTLFCGKNWEFAATQRSPAAQLDGFDLVLYIADVKPVSNQTAVRLNFLTSKGVLSPKFILEKPTVFLSLGSPYHLLDVPRMKTVINAYADDYHVIELLAEKLLGRSQFIGTSPVDPSCGLEGILIN
jgi:beta-N-acetylhexosaminidase